MIIFKGFNAILLHTECNEKCKESSMYDVHINT